MYDIAIVFVISRLFLFWSLDTLPFPVLPSYSMTKSWNKKPGKKKHFSVMLYVQNFCEPDVRTWEIIQCQNCPETMNLQNPRQNDSFHYKSALLDCLFLLLLLVAIFGGQIYLFLLWCMQGLHSEEAGSNALFSAKWVRVLLTLRPAHMALCQSSVVTVVTLAPLLLMPFYRSRHWKPLVSINPLQV